MTRELRRLDKDVEESELNQARLVGATGADLTARPRTSFLMSLDTHCPKSAKTRRTCTFGIYPSEGNS